jgi:hypothetical protein
VPRSAPSTWTASSEVMSERARTRRHDLAGASIQGFIHHGSSSIRARQVQFP